MCGCVFGMSVFFLLRDCNVLVFPKTELHWGTGLQTQISPGFSDRSIVKVSIGVACWKGVLSCCPAFLQEWQSVRAQQRETREGERGREQERNKESEWASQIKRKRGTKGNRKGAWNKISVSTTAAAMNSLGLSKPLKGCNLKACQPVLFHGGSTRFRGAERVMACSPFILRCPSIVGKSSQHCTQDVTHG